MSCCQRVMSGTLDRLPVLKPEEGGDDVKSVWPLRPGLHTYYNAQYNVNRDRKVEEILKTGPSSDWGRVAACNLN